MEKHERITHLDDVMFHRIRHLRETMTHDQKLIVVNGMPMVVEKNAMDKITDKLRGIFSR